MSEPAESFGSTLGRKLHAEHNPELIARTLRQTEVSVTEVRLETPTNERSGSLPPINAYAIALQLRDFPVHEWWEDGRRAPITCLKAGQITIYDLRRDPRFRINSAFHSIHVQLPLTLLGALSEESGDGRNVELEYTSGLGIDDPVLASLTSTLRPVFQNPDQASRLHIDSITTAVAAHVASRYGNVRERRRGISGGLSPWQVRRAIALINSRLDGKVPITELASECRLSANYFVRAFRTSTGVTPHRWLQQRRIEKAKELLRDRTRTATDVALSCGFADQSHLTRVFRSLCGCPPVEWRRHN